MSKEVHYYVIPVGVPSYTAISVEVSYDAFLQLRDEFGRTHADFFIEDEHFEGHFIERWYVCWGDPADNPPRIFFGYAVYDEEGYFE